MGCNERPRFQPRGRLGFVAPDVLTLPNFLTLLRIIVIPVVLAVLAKGDYALAFILLVGAGITDVVDGAVARINQSHSELGALLDPMADKLLLLSSFAVLAVGGHVPGWLVVLVIMRDVILMVGYVAVFVVDHEWMSIDPSRLGKMTTFVQLFTLGFALVGEARPDLPLRWFNYSMQTLTAAVTAGSGVQYVYRGLLWHQRRGNFGA